MDKKLSLQIVLLILIFCNTAFAQNDSTNSENVSDSIKEVKNVKFNPFPYFSHNKVLGYYYGGGGMLTYRLQKQDTISPRSTSGAFYVRTTNETWFSVLFTQMYFNEDKWRVIAATGTGLYNFQTYTELPDSEPDFYDYGSRSIMVSAKVYRKVFKKNYLGLGYYYSRTKTRFEEAETDSISKNNSLQMLFLRDTRDNVYYPKKGSKLNAMFTLYPDWMGNVNNFGIFNAYYNRYYGIRNDKDVLAVRAYAKVATSTLDFQRQVVINGIDLRGYTDGKYRGDGKVNIQAEYRWNFLPRIGLVGFGGVGTLYGSEFSEFNGSLYPSGGLGVRYLAIKSTQMRLGLDFARGKDDYAIYFRIGEAF